MFNIHELIQVYTIHWTAPELIIFSIILLIALCKIKEAIYSEDLSLSQGIGIFLLILFLGLVISSTVLTRSTLTERRWNLALFSSWKKAMYYHNAILWRQIVLNIVLLMPLGALLPMVYGRIVDILTAWKIGVYVSAGIELGQLFFKCGVFELDDILGNSVGCIIGFIAVNRIFEIIYDRRRKEVYNKFWTLATSQE